MKPCWDNGGAEYKRHDYGEHGTDDTCTRCGYEIDRCVVAVYMESSEYGGEWTACDGEAQWCGRSGKRKPTPLCDGHKREKSAADPAMTFTRYDPATAEHTYVDFDEMCTLPFCHHGENEDCSTQEAMWFLSADL